MKRSIVLSAVAAIALTGCVERTIMRSSENVKIYKDWYVSEVAVTRLAEAECGVYGKVPVETGRVDIMSIPGTCNPCHVVFSCVPKE